MKLKRVFDLYIGPIEKELKHFTKECLEVSRWNGIPTTMLVDAAFTSVGMNYFGVVVPKVREFQDKFLRSRKITCFRDLAFYRKMSELFGLFDNRRAWSLAKEAARYFSGSGLPDKKALVEWAREADYHNWTKNPIGKIKGVGINTFQYLRMQGGVDTIMPDKIVIRVLGKICREGGYSLRANNEIEYIDRICELADRVGYKPIELCWASWLIFSEKGKKV